MKRFCLITLTIVAALICAFALPGCKKEHVHTWNDGIVTRAATCGADGEALFTCTECGASETRAITERPEHTVVTDTDTTLPTCTEPGYTGGTYCSVCGEVFEGHVETPATGHDWGEGWVTLTTPTCLATGLEKRTCVKCGDSEQNVLEKLPHVEVEIAAVDPDCTHTGLTEGVKCGVCETVLVEQQTVDVLGHDYGEWEHVSNDDGVLTHELVSMHIRRCGRVGCSSIETGQCVFDQTVTPATCLDPEKHTHKCPDCEFSFTHDVDGRGALGHDFDSMPYEIEYNYKTSSFKHFKTCSRCDEKDEASACTFGEQPEVHVATCTSAQLNVYECDVCHGKKTETVGSPLSHDIYFEKGDYIDGTYYHVRKCRTCDLEERVSCDIVAGEVPATCEDDGRQYVTCARCGRDDTVAVLSALGHNYTGWQYDEDGEPLHHKKVCQRAECDSVIVEPCNMQSADKAPTCNAAGFDGEVCTVCEHVEGNEVEQLLHKWKIEQSVRSGKPHHQRKCETCGFEEDVLPCADFAALTSERKATCTVKGKKDYMCSVCGKQWNEEIPDLGGRHSYIYTDNGSTHHVSCSVCDYESNMQHNYTESLTCPCGHNGLSVRQQGGTWVVIENYSARATLKHLVIPDSLPDGGYISAIGAGAFRDFTALETVVIPYTVTVINASAFSGCPRLKEVTFSSSPEKPSQLTRILDSAFANCAALTSITIPDSVTELANGVFNGCRSLRDIGIPEGILKIGEAVFYDTAYARDPEKWTEGGLYLDTMLVGVSNESIEHSGGQFVIRNGTTTVCAGAFRGCTALTDLSIPASVVEFGRNAFGFPMVVEDYPSCDALSRVTFAGNLAQWIAIKFENDYANPMHYAKALHIEETEETITIPHGVTRIPNGTFRGNTTITHIEIPDTVTVIGDHAFSGCTSLVYINIPDSVVEIGTGAFDGTPIIEGRGEGIAFDESGLLYVGKHLLRADPAAASGDIVIAPDIITISAYAFSGCELVTGVTIDTNVVFIGFNAFKGLDKTLKKVTFLARTGGVWMSWTDSIGRGLTDDYLCGDANAARNVDVITRVYVGEWRYNRASA